MDDGTKSHDLASYDFSDFNSTPATGEEDSTFTWLLYKIVTPTQNGIITLVGACGNSLVIYVILSNHNMRTVTNLLLLNLAVADLCFVGIVPPCTASQHFTSTWPFGNAACKLMHYLVNVTAYVTVYTLVLVSIIRYMTIVHSVRTAPIRTRRNVLMAVAAIWVMMLAVNVPILWSYGVTPDGFCDSYSPDIAKRVFATFFAFAYVIPLAVIAIISVAILLHITGQRASSMVLQQKTRSADRKRQVGRLLILVVVVFALLWLPFHIFILVVYFYGTPSEGQWHEAVYVLCTGLAYSNSCVNPIIYNRTSKDFRDAFRSAVGCQKPARDDVDAATAAAPLRAGRAATARRRPDDMQNIDVDDGDRKIHLETVGTELRQ